MIHRSAPQLLCNLPGGCVLKRTGLSALLIAFLFLPPLYSQTAAPPEADRTAIEVKPGQPAIKTTELERKPVAPWKRFPEYLLQDQKAIWTSPFHTSKSDAKWWGIFGGATAVLIATDKTTSRQLPNTKDQVSFANITSKMGAAYTLVPVSAAFYFAGALTKNDRLRETGFLGAEALANSLITVNVIKIATQRERPTEGNGDGRFFQGKGRIWNSGAGFPSGHAIETWAMASVIAHQYPHPRIVPILAYGLATTVAGSRFAARKHFASDIVVGAAMGWFIGDYVFGKRHDPEVDPPRSKLRRFLAHINLGP